MTPICPRDRLFCPERRGWPCAVDGCTRATPVSPAGIRFAHCDDHTRTALSEAFGTKPALADWSPGEIVEAFGR